jgi:thiamine biosynthesis protein ThiC
MTTPLAYARQGTITNEKKIVAQTKGLSEIFINDMTNKR